MVGLLCFIKYLVESCCTFISFSFFLSVFICVIFFRYFYSLPFLLWKTTFPTFIRYPTDIINERFNRKKKDVSYILKVYHDSFYELCGIEPYEVCFGFFFCFCFGKLLFMPIFLCRLILFAGVEICWNIYPSTFYSSLILLCIHVIILWGLWMAPVKPSYVEDEKSHGKEN